MLQTKALYNLLRLNAKEDPSIPIEPWIAEDLREASLDELWGKLAELKIPLDRTRLTQFASECDSPEMLTDLLLGETQADRYDELYLILFELWRRFFPERASLSIFCDELDHQIKLYDSGKLESDEAIQDGLANLLEILEEHVDHEMSPKDAFSSILEYFANDVPLFLYDYITDLLDQGNLRYGSELLEEFAPYLLDPVRFGVLEARLLSETDVIQANHQIRALLEQPLELDLLFEVVQLIAAVGEHDLFQAAIKKLLSLVQEPEDQEEMMDLTLEYYRRLDLEELEQAVSKIKEKQPLNLEEFKKIIFANNVLLP